MRLKVVFFAVLFLVIGVRDVFSTPIQTFESEKEPPYLPAQIPEKIVAYPEIKIPAKAIMKLNRPGNNSRFKLRFTRFVDDSGPTDLEYEIDKEGWCADRTKKISDGNHEVRLFLTFVPGDIPSDYRKIKWPMINYMLNHRSGYSIDEVQEAIWWLTNGPREGKKLSWGAQFLLDEATNNGAEFIPEEGQIAAILCYPALKQVVFFEVIVPAKEELPVVVAAPPVAPAVSSGRFFFPPLFWIPSGGGDNPPNRPPPHEPPKRVDEPQPIILLGISAIAFSAWWKFRKKRQA